MFSDRLKELRKEHNLTQSEFAKLFCISNGAVGNWESGKRNPDNEMLKRLSEYFNVSIDYLLDNEIKSVKDNQLDSYERTLLKEIRTLDESERLDVLAYIKFRKAHQQNIKLVAENSGSGEAVKDKNPRLT